MARTAQSRKVGDVTYNVIPLTTTDATAAAIRVANVAGPLIRAWDSGQTVAIGQALIDLKAEDLEYFTSLFRPLTTYDATVKGKKTREALDATYDDHFAANLDALVSWLAFCIEVNFKSFFPRLAALGLKPVSVKPADAAAPEETTGESP